MLTLAFEQSTLLYYYEVAVEYWDFCSSWSYFDGGKFLMVPPKSVNEKTGLKKVFAAQFLADWFFLFHLNSFCQLELWEVQIPNS